jgi:hypothetical protein
MKRSLVASLFLIALVAIAGGSRVAPVAAAPAPPGIGACKYICPTVDGVFTNLNACTQACLPGGCFIFC